MNELLQPIAQARSSVCALMRIVSKQRGKSKGGPKKIQFRLTFVGTGWCIVDNRYILTAYHVLNGGNPRDQNDKFYAFIVPTNGPQAFHFPVAAFPYEDARTDMAILELGPISAAGQQITAIPVTLSRPADGTKVLTIGFPAPEIIQANVAPNGDYKGGQFFLKSHANEGILAAQYDLGPFWFYEFNVGWHHGESGGPVIQVDPVAAFSIMQHYRNVQSPHGILPGPHRGQSLHSIQNELRNLGATII